MSMLFDDEQKALAESVRAFLADTAPPSRVREVMATPEGVDRAHWTRCAAELGLHGMAVPEEFGGAGFSDFEQAIVFEEMGRALYTGPYLASVALAAAVVTASGDETAQKRLLPALADGSVVGTVALVDRDGSLGSPAVTARPAADGALALDGTAHHVLAAATADVLLLVVDTEDGAALVEVDLRSATGVRIEPLGTLDQTRKQAHVHLTGTAASTVGVANGHEVVDRALDLARVMLAAEQLGVAQACLEASVEYAKIRTQFGRPIGSFQAIKHRCADMLIAAETARSAVYHAADLARAGASAAVAAPMALALATDAALFAARQNIQIHGGIGCTWEHDAHLYYRRAESNALLLGSSDNQRRLLATRVGIRP
ncbi:acyl-CoA dehydrogenase family protein [Pseudonocardia xishanensis]|uniref:Acyl-CoA dehydrogenase family protein n=1 Tax=Pseudonocardia xishanensis TaxID=630995 RepID=A0ABP8RVA5_9PSEU